MSTYIENSWMVVPTLNLSMIKDLIQKFLAQSTKIQSHDMTFITYMGV